MARKGAFDPNLVVTRSSPLAKQTPGGFTALPKGAAGSLAQGLRAAVKDGLRDVEPTLIDEQGVPDRIGDFEEDDLALRESLQRHGQLVPVLLRPNAEQQGRYEIIYGRRRVRAAKALGMPVKAIIRDLAGEEALVAQGQENTARRDLSFIEKARFARLILEDGYSRDVATEALHCHPTVLSVMLNVARDVPEEMMLLIGPAPGIGRDRWFDFAKRLRTTEVATGDMLGFLADPEIANLPSDERFARLGSYLDRASRPEPRAATEPAEGKGPRELLEADSRAALANLERTGRWVALKIPTTKQRGFANWVDQNAEQLMNELHARYRQEAGLEQ